MRSTKLKVATVGASCAALGAIAGIAGAAASPSSKSSTPAAAATVARPHGAHRFHGGFGLAAVGGRGSISRAVHLTATVLDRAGTGFITVTEDAGTVSSVNGNVLTIREGVGKVTYRTVDLTIPSSATIRRDHQSASLSQLKSGDRVRIVQSSQGTRVAALDPSLLARRWAQHGSGARSSGQTPSAEAPTPAG